MTRQWQPEAGALYLGDNGACLCARHLGATARATGRDLSGQALHRLTEDDQRYARDTFGCELTCETCEASS